MSDNVSEKTVKDLFAMVNLLSGEVRHLRTLIHWHEAQIRAIHIMAGAKIADLTGESREAVFEQLKKATLGIYDESIEAIEEKFPHLAADIDIRDKAGPEVQEWIYPLDKYYPPPDGSSKS